MNRPKDILGKAMWRRKKLCFQSLDGRGHPYRNNAGQMSPLAGAKTARLRYVCGNASRSPSLIEYHRRSE
jgi:hypothetical protein